MSELEQKMQAEDITAKIDTAYYGTPKQRNFNALDYSLDNRHRYQRRQMDQRVASVNIHSLDLGVLVPVILSA